MIATSKTIAARSPTTTPLSFPKDERGLTTVEYVVILVLIAVGGIAIWQAFGGEVNQRIDSSRVSIETMSAQNGSEGNSPSAGVGTPAAHTPTPAAPAVTRGAGKRGGE